MSNTSKRQSLQKERSFDSSTGRPTKYFKLDRTYSDVVEDELYDPQAAKESNSVPSTKILESKTERIQNVYPQLFTRAPSDGSLRPETAATRQDQYWPGMESGIRFDREKLDVKRNETIIADRKQKHNSQPLQSTVSPKEAFLDYPDNADFDPKGSVFDFASVQKNDQNDQPVTLNRNGSSLSARGIHFPPQVSSQPSRDMAAPKTITPVRAHEKLSPRPVTSVNIDSPGPSRAQAHNNAVANAKIRALYKEESTTSNASLGSELQTPPSVAGSDSEYSPPHVRQSETASYPKFECEECHETFSKSIALELHARVHARPPPTKTNAGPPQDSKPEEEDDGEDDRDIQDDYDGSRSPEHHGDGNKMKHKVGGPHRCDWIIPTTGQVCGTIFSRPYDLVRHQDTIHRAKKLEFKCELCIAAGTNKVFSRNDALVRHMRHVHKQNPK